MRSKNAKTDATKDNEDPLARATKQALEAVRAIRKLAPFLEHEMARCVRLQQRIDAAFDGQLFLPDESPTSARNMQRFRAYFGMLTATSKLKIKLLHELMRIHGVDPNHPHEMWEVPTIAGASGAAGAPAGAPAQHKPDGQPIPWEPPPGQYSPEVLRLARHLHAGAHELKGPFDANSAAKAFSGTRKASDGAKVH